MYPDRNPFPPQAIMSLDGMASFSIEGIPTALSRVPLQRLDLIQRRYRDDWPGTGRAVALHGEPGAGKTHILLFALSELTKRPASTGRSPRSPIVLYVRADGPDPVLLYQKLMSRWTTQELVSLTEEAFASYAADEFIESRDFIQGSDDAAEGASDIPEELRSDPELVMKAISDSELSGTAIIDRAEGDIVRIQGHFGSFERALRALSNPRLSSSARRWLIADEVSTDELERLGVPGNINDIPQVRIGIHVLAALSHRARRPLTLAVDQVEAFLTTDDGMIDRTNVGLLRSVVEAVTEEKGFLVAAVSADAWRDMPRDLRQRFGPSEIEVRGLSPDEARDMLAAYLAPWPPHSGQPSTFPFQDEAVRQLLVASGGNVRRFIQKSHEVFKVTSQRPQGIGREAVIRGLAATGGERSPNEADVRLAVERSLRKSGSPFSVEDVIDGHIIDYTVVQGNRILLALEISQAVFGQDEAARAVQQIETIRTLRQHQPTIILVVVGYSSPEVIDKLVEAADSVIVADSYRFATDLDEKIIEAVQISSAAATFAIDERLDKLQAELAALADQRGQEEQLVAERLRQASTQPASADWQAQLRAFRRSWSLERQRIEQDMDQRRSERRLADLEEIVRHHDQHVVRLYNRRRNQALFFLLAAGLAAAGLSTELVVARTAIFAVSISIGTIGILGVTGALVLMTRTRPKYQARTGTIRSIEDLDRVAGQQGQPDPYSDDPYERYAATLSEERPAISIRDLTSMAQREPTAIVRRRLVAQLAGRETEGVEAALAANLDQATLSVAVERASPAIERSSPLPRRLRILAEIHGAAIREKRSISRVFSLLMDVPPRAIDSLAQAFVTGDDNLLAHAVDEIRERDLRRANSELSPFDDDALGAYYWLNAAETIDGFYLFFRKAAFFSAGGLEPPTQAV